MENEEYEKYEDDDTCLDRIKDMTQEEKKKYIEKFEKANKKSDSLKNIP